MAVPKFEEFILPTLSVLTNEAELPISEICDYVAIELDVSEDDLSERLSSGTGTRFHDRVRWALTYLFQAGLVRRPRRAVYSLTSEGIALLEKKPVRVDKQLLRSYPAFRAFEGRRRPDAQDKTPTEHRSSATTPEDRIESAYVEWREGVEARLLSLVQQAPPDFLEQVVVELLIKLGYGGGDPERGVVTGGAGDGGIDGVIGEDALGLSKVYFQAKRYQEGANVGAADVRQFLGSLVQRGTTQGVLVTTSAFTDGAVQAADQGQYRIVLISGEELARLMVQNDVGVREGAEYHIKRIDFAYFPEPQPE